VNSKKIIEKFGENATSCPCSVYTLDELYVNDTLTLSDISDIGAGIEFCFNCSGVIKKLKDALEQEARSLANEHWAGKDKIVERSLREELSEL